MRVNGSGWVSWVTKAGWKTMDLKDFTPRKLPLVAPLWKGGLLVYGGRDEKSTVLYDGIIINVLKKTVVSSFSQPEMPLYSLCHGQITPKGEVLAFGVVNRDTFSRAVRFDESEKRFQPLSTIPNSETDFKDKME